jgi:hypothetical protein
MSAGADVQITYTFLEIPDPARGSTLALVLAGGLLARRRTQG